MTARSWLLLAALALPVAWLGASAFVQERALGQSREWRIPIEGYDPRDPSMAATFVAAGPALRSGGVLPPFDNVDVHPFLLRLLGLPAMATDGNPRTLAPALR